MFQIGWFLEYKLSKDKISFKWIKEPIEEKLICLAHAGKLRKDKKGINRLLEKCKANIKKLEFPRVEVMQNEAGPINNTRPDNRMGVSSDLNSFRWRSCTHQIRLWIIWWPKFTKWRNCNDHISDAESDEGEQMTKM